eukprot:Em0019g1146a
MAPCTKVKSVLRSCLLDCSCARWGCWHYWRSWFKPLVGLIYLVIVVLVMPLLVWKLYRLETTPHFKAWFVAGVFVLLTLPVFLYGLVLHLLNYTQPHLQHYIIRIIFIVPIYSIDSFLGLLYPPSAIYWTTIRNCYESFVLYSFLRYLLNFLEHSYAPLDDTLNARPAFNPGAPCCCMPSCPKGRPFIKRCMVGVLQYTIIKVVLTLLALITQLAGVYQDGTFKFNNPFLYFTIIETVSQIVAIIHLLYFFKGTYDLLKPLQPIAKFASIKAIVFLLFWQAVIIGILKATGVLKQGVWQNYDVDDVAQGLQDFVVCIEMLLFAIAHLFIFSHRPFVDPAAAQVPCITSCLRMLDVRDVYSDVKHHFVDPIPIPNLIRLRKREVNGECADEGESQASELPVADAGVGEQVCLLGTDQTRIRGSEQVTEQEIIKQETGGVKV